MNQTVKNYYLLTKPGIIYGNVITTIAGFLLASRFHGSISIFLGVVIGTACVIASACVFNNYMDRGIDQKMERTKKRALVTGAIPINHAIVYAIILALVGFGTLTVFTNLLTVFVGLIGFADYIILYGISKRKSEYGTLVGSISGATPILAGYTAVTNKLDAGGIILFLILVLWQMPHFYAIAMYRLKDYANANIPVLPVKKGMQETKIHMLFYIIAFLAATLMLSVYKLTGLIYAIAVSALSIYWLYLSVTGFFTNNDRKWARKMFFFSLIVIVGISILLPLGVVLP